jgi:hypothetical protein
VKPRDLEPTVAVVRLAAEPLVGVDPEIVALDPVTVLDACAAGDESTTVRVMTTWCTPR